MSITPKYEDDMLYSLCLGDEEFFSEGDDKVIIPISVLKGESIEDWPSNTTIEICDAADGNAIILHNTPTTITKLNSGEIQIEFDETITRKYWDAPIGLKLWMETKRDIIAERGSQVGDVSVDSYEDDGAWISLTYSSTIAASTFEELFIFIDNLYNEIEGATDLALGSPFEKLENCQKESDFTVKVLLPLFRNLGFANVKYNHGNREYGKDIIFARRTEFDEYEHYGVQVKFGDVSGGATGEVGTLIAQARDAFSMPFYDVYTRRQARVSKVIVAISGRFTNNAIDKIIDGITDYPMKNNLIFLDGDKISTLIERYRRF